jgi:hypothetical protein
MEILLLYHLTPHQPCFEVLQEHKHCQNIYLSIVKSGRAVSARPVTWMRKNYIISFGLETGRKGTLTTLTGWTQVGCSCGDGNECSGSAR